MLHQIVGIYGQEPQILMLQCWEDDTLDADDAEDANASRPKIAEPPGLERSADSGTAPSQVQEQDHAAILSSLNDIVQAHRDDDAAPPPERVIKFIGIVTRPDEAVLDTAAEEGCMGLQLLPLYLRGLNARGTQ